METVLLLSTTSAGSIAEMQPVSLSDAVIRVAIATFLFACVGFGAAIWLSRRRHDGAMPSNNRLTQWLSGTVAKEGVETIEIVQRLRVGPSQSLLHIKWLEEDLLLGCTSQSLQLLDRRGSEGDAQSFRNAEGLET